jgi:hypothetical protein
MTVSTNPIVANGYTDLSGTQVAAGATGVTGVTSYKHTTTAHRTSAKLSSATRRLVYGQLPCDIVLAGDSTANDTTEWFYLMGSQLATNIARNHTVAYRLWSDTAQHYSSASAVNIQVGPLGRRYIYAGQATTSHRVELTDSAATSPTGDLDVRALINLEGGGVSTQFPVASKFGGAGSRSWRLEVTTANQLFFEHSADGTAQINRTSSVALSGAQLTSDIWIRVTLDVDNGTAGNTAIFYTSTDGNTWTQLGTTSTIAGTTSLFDTTQSLQWIGRGSGSISSIGKNIRFYELRVFGSLDNTNMVAWMDAGSIPPRSSATSIAYNDDLGNAGTITFQGSTVVGSPRLCLFNGSVGGQTISYASNGTRFPKMMAGGGQAVFINYSHNEANDVEYRTDYKTLTDLIVAKWPGAAIVGVLQNQRLSPATQIQEHFLRLQQIADFCAEQNFDVLDHYSLVNSSQMNADGVHPEVSSGVETILAEAATSLVSSSSDCWSIPT